MTRAPILPVEVAVPSGRLRLREWRRDDAAAISEAIWSSREHLRPWMAWVAGEPMPLADRGAQIDGWSERRLAGGDATYGIWLVDGDDELAIGGTGFHRRSADHPDRIEIGYWVHVDHVGRGVASETAAALTDAALALPGISTVAIHHDVRNRASAAVPARLGFVRYPDEPADGGALHGVWRVDRRTWAARQRR